LYCFFHGDLVAFKGISASVGILGISFAACTILIFATLVHVGTTQPIITARTTMFLSVAAFTTSVLAATEL
jgi:hypothetical protein